MNENIDLTKILKDCPKGTKLYSTVFGEVEFDKIIKEETNYPIVFVTTKGDNFSATANGKHYEAYDGECTLFPSKDQKDWSKFTAPWYKKEKFDPKTLKPFDKVLARTKHNFWSCELFSFIDNAINIVKCCGIYYDYCVPYNDETKYLIGTTEEAPEFYRYWED